jgi:HPt (histidine-containing phosphotransfer) domain-containing protein
MTKINLEYLNELCNGDVDFISEMLQTYIDETSKDVEYLVEAVKLSDTPRIVFWSHKIKTAFRILGLDGLAEKAETLEIKSRLEDFKIDDFSEHVYYIVENASNSFKQAKWLLEGF